MARKHGLGKDRFYNIACSARCRCTDPSNRGYPYYGGRGIEFRFHSPEEMARYIAALDGANASEMSLDRIDNDGHYEVGNLRWATRSEQALNRRSTRWLELDGVRRPLSEWANKACIPVRLLSSRLKRGWTLREALEISHVGNGRKRRSVKA